MRLLPAAIRWKFSSNYSDYNVMRNEVAAAAAFRAEAFRVVVFREEDFPVVAEAAQAGEVGDKR